jgi:teichuronic acid biosynthesis glycosyltransferase TuaC
MDILFVTNMFPEPGNPASGTFVGTQAAALRREGHAVTVLNIHGNASRLNYLARAFDVRRATRTHRYDVVHAHYGLSGIPALLRYRTPLVVTLYGSDVLVGTVQPMISGFVCRRADAVIVMSKAMARKVAGRCIPCGIDLEFFTPRERDASRAALGLPPDRKLVLFPFNPNRRVKRFDIALSVRDLLRRRGHDIDLISTGSVPVEHMPLFYSASDAVLLCSDSEGSPTAVKEALACNVPVVSVDVGDVSEILAGVDGARVVPRDAAALADALEEVITKGRASFNGRAAAERYGEKRSTRALIDVYESVCRRAAR